MIESLPIIIDRGVTHRVESEKKRLRDKPTAGMVSDLSSGNKKGKKRAPKGDSGQT